MVNACRPLSLEEALVMRSREATTVFAGGSDLMVKYRQWSGVTPDFPGTVLFVGHLPELQRLDREKDAWKIGAACTIAQILQDQGIPDHLKLPLLSMASPSIRNVATLGGNICNASPAGDTLPMLYALDARLTLQSRDNARTVAIADFITGPGKTILAADEILTEITIPPGDWPRVYYKKAGTRRANSVSKVTFYAVARFDGDRIADIRMAFGAAAPTVVRNPAAEALLQNIDKNQVPALLETLTTHYADSLRPIDDLRSTGKYRQQTALRILAHFLRRELA